MSILSILAAILVFAVLIVVHEFGHFIVAKRSGVRVDEFAIGFPPRLWSIKRGETTYSINLLPLGGYVRMPGENGETTDENGNPDPRTFGAQKAGTRAAILVAGVTMNFILAWVLYMIIFGTIGAPKDTTIVSLVTPNSPAAVAGLKNGDQVIAVNGQSVGNSTSVIDVVDNAIANDHSSSTTVPITLSVERNGQAVDLTVNARKSPPKNQGPMGVGFQIQYFHPPVWQLPGYSLHQITVDNFVAIGQAFHQMFLGIIKVGDAFNGPVGIVQQTSQAASYGWIPLLSIMAYLSWSLAVLNLFPIPGLDGGRLLIIGVEVLRRGKRLAPEREALINLAGLVFLLSLMVIFTINDISHIIGH